MNKDSNILMVPSFSDYHQEFTKKIENNKQFLDMKFGLSLMKSNNLSEQQRSNLSDININMNMNFYPNDPMIIDPPISFIQLINEDGLELVSLDSIDGSQDRFLLEIKIEEIYPLPIDNIMNVMCKKCKETYQLREVNYNSEGQFKCLNCSSVEKGKLHFNSYMKCRDKQSAQVVIIHLCSFDDEGKSFYGLKHCALLEDNNYRVLNQHLKELTEKESFIKIKVEAIKIDENNKKIYRLIGNYETNYSNELIL